MIGLEVDPLIRNVQEALDLNQGQDAFNFKFALEERLLRQIFDLGQVKADLLLTRWVELDRHLLQEALDSDFIAKGLFGVESLVKRVQGAEEALLLIELDIQLQSVISVASWGILVAHSSDLVCFVGTRGTACIHFY